MTRENLLVEENARYMLELEEQKKFLLWFQKVKEPHFLDGNCNTRFFHLSTIVRRRYDNTNLLTVGNNRVEGQDEIAGVMVSFYDNLFNLFPLDLSRMTWMVSFSQ